jgi:large subunit ribosomal protein L19
MVLNSYDTELNNIKKPIFNVGDFIEISYLINDNDTERIQKYKGIVISINKNTTFTLYQTINQIKIEQIFSFNSPKIIFINIINKAKKKRAKLYFIRSFTLKNIKKRIF